MHNKKSPPNCNYSVWREVVTCSSFRKYKYPVCVVDGLGATLSVRKAGKYFILWLSNRSSSAGINSYYFYIYYPRKYFYNTMR